MISFNSDLNCQVLPDNISTKDAATILVQGLTALTMLRGP